MVEYTRMFESLNFDFKRLIDRFTDFVLKLSHIQCAHYVAFFEISFRFLSAVNE